MKILLVHNYYSARGGEDEYFDNLKRLLRNTPHKIISFAVSNVSTNTLLKKIKAIKSLFSTGDALRELDVITETERPDVALVNNVYPLIGAGVYKMFSKKRIPVIQLVHNYRLLHHREADFGYDNYRSGLYKKILRKSVSDAAKSGLYNLIDCFVFPTRFSAKNYLENARFKIKKHAVIPHFVDTYGIKPQSKKSDYFLYAGRFSKEKGVLPLVKVFSHLPQSKLLVVGDGPDLKKVKEYQKYQNIRILGWTAKIEVMELMARARALVLPSLSYEVMPLSLIESLTLKTPVIVPHTPTYKEIIKNNRGASFFRPGDFDDLEDKVVNFDGNSKVTGDYSTTYSPQKYLEEILRLCRKISRN